MKFRFVDCFGVEVCRCAVVCIMIIGLIVGVVKILIVGKLEVLLGVRGWIFSYLK